jgi:hypothetical protein
MTKLAITIGILATVLCGPAEAQTVSVTVLDRAGADRTASGDRERAAAECAVSNSGG